MFNDWCLIKLFMIHSNNWNHSQKENLSSVSLKMLATKCVYKLYRTYICTGWNDKIVVLKKTTLQFYFILFLDLWATVESCCHTQGLPPAAWLHQGITNTLQLIQVYFGVDFRADFEDVRWHNVALTWNHTKDHNHSRTLCFHHPGHVPVIRGNPALS